MNPSLDPSPILQTAFAFWNSKVLLTAVEIGLFTKLGSRRLTADELGRELGLHPRGTGISRRRCTSSVPLTTPCPPGGALMAIENIIDDARRENVFGLLMSLNMLIEFGEAFDFTGADFRDWCSQAGFKRFEPRHLAGPCSVAIARK